MADVDTTTLPYPGTGTTAEHNDGVREDHDLAMAALRMVGNIGA